MKKWTALLLLLLLIAGCAQAEWSTGVQTAQVPQLELRPSAEEVKVFASPNMKANIVGYIITGGQQVVEPKEIQGDWVYVGFTSIYGVSYGWIPMSFFQPAATAVPFPTAAPQAEYQAFVTNVEPGYRLNLREKASAASASMGKYYTGTPVTVISSAQNGYVQVRIGSRTGFMAARYLTEDPYSFISELRVADVQNGTGGANLRNGPSLNDDKIGWYPTGTSVTVLGVTQTGWYHVAVNGQTGYMSAELMDIHLSWEYGFDSDDPASSGVVSAYGTMYVTGSDGGVNLRREANHTSKVLGRFYNGTAVTVVNYNRLGWSYVRIGSLEGYMASSYLYHEAPQQYGEQRLIRNTRGTGLNLRTLPTTSSEVIALIPNYTTVTVLADLQDDWCYVQVGDQLGYMMGTHLKTP